MIVSMFLVLRRINEQSKIYRDIIKLLVVVSRKKTFKDNNIIQFNDECLSHLFTSDCYNFYNICLDCYINTEKNTLELMW